MTAEQEKKEKKSITMPNNAIVNINTTSTTQTQQQLADKPMFHDFLGMKKPTDSQLGFPNKATAAESPQASASLGASSGGARGPISTTSDLGSGESPLLFSFWSFSLHGLLSDLIYTLSLSLSQSLSL